MNGKESKIRKRGAILLNVLVIGFALALAVVLARTYIFSSEPKLIAIGDRISLSDTPPVEAGKRLVVLFLRSDCVFCTKSAEFYKAVSAGLAQSANTRVIAVFSTIDSRSDEYMGELGLADLQMVRASLGSLGIAETPTIVLIDDANTVQEVWRGKLSRKQEVEFKQKLGIPVDDWYIQESEISDLKKPGQVVTIVDVQNRDSYSRNHLLDAKNIQIGRAHV